MLPQCWHIVCDAVSVLRQHWARVVCLLCEHSGLFRMRSFIHRRRCHGDNVRGDSMARSCCEIRCCFYSAHLRSCFHNAKGRDFWRKRNRSLHLIRDAICVCFPPLNPYNAGTCLHKPGNKRFFFNLKSS